MVIFTGLGEFSFIVPVFLNVQFSFFIQSVVQKTGVQNESACAIVPDQETNGNIDFYSVMPNISFILPLNIVEYVSRH